MNSLLILVLNRLLSQFNLEIQNNRLFYNYITMLGTTPLLVIKLKKDSLFILSEFLGLPYFPAKDNAEDIYYAITNSDYFNVKLFNTLIYPNETYKQFLDILKAKKPLNIYKQHNIPGFNTTLIDRTFGSKIHLQIKNLQRNGVAKTILKRKFNGHLICKWVTFIPKGPEIPQIMKDFKMFISEEFDINFIEYLLERPENLIRKDFINYYLNELDYFDRLFSTAILFEN